MNNDQPDNTPVYRPEDSELMGLIRQDPENTDSWQPTTTFGYPLADSMSKSEAVAYLQAHGLEALLDRWQFLDRSDQEWYNCVIVEAKPDTVTVKITDYGHPGVHQIQAVPEPILQHIRRLK